MPFFPNSARASEKVRIPAGYRRSGSWHPRLGDIFPDFEAETTFGKVRFFDWAEGHWTVLASHPSAFTGVCTSEVLAMAEAQPDFNERNVRCMGFCTSSLADQIAWHEDIERSFGVNIDFPSIADASGQLSETFGMVYDDPVNDVRIRKTYILDPQMRVRMIFEYPHAVGRSTDETLRAIDALQAHDRIGAATPADWKPGDDYMLNRNLRARLNDPRIASHVAAVNTYVSMVKRSIDPVFDFMPPVMRTCGEQDFF